jgi:hypothetical protein
VEVGAIDDDVADTNETLHMAHSVVSEDPFYQDANVPLEFSGFVTCLVTDNDVTTVVLSKQEIYVGENGSVALYAIRLSSDPDLSHGEYPESYGVEIKMSLDTDVNISIFSVLFDTTNWWDDQWITVSAEEDNTLTKITW